MILIKYVTIFLKSSGFCKLFLSEEQKQVRKKEDVYF